MNSRTSVLLVLACVLSISASAIEDVDDAEDKLVKKVIHECTESKARLQCFSYKAAMVLERSLNLDIPLIGGVKLVRNGEPIRYQEGRALSGFGRLKTALWNFLDTHKLSVDLTGDNNLEARSKGETWNDSQNSKDDNYFSGGTEDGSGEDKHQENSNSYNKVSGYYRGGKTGLRKDSSSEITSKGFRGKSGDDEGEGGGGGGGGGRGGKRGKKSREKKYMQYAFMVLLGIFGLTGPLVMKTLAVIAAKALIASKVALIIVGSVALKKIFEKDHDHPSVKVHTITADHEDEHDRLYNYNQILPYSAYNAYAKPVQ